MPNPRITATRQNVEQANNTTRAWLATKPTRRIDWSPEDFQTLKAYGQARDAAVSELNQALAEATVLESVDEVQEGGGSWTVYWSETVELTTSRPFRAFATPEEAEEFSSWLVGQVGRPALEVRNEMEERATAQNGGR